SSSLTAIHLACQDLKAGRTSLALAGGVNVSIHPNKYLMLSAGQFISSDGHCQSFGEGGDGYIPGEGVGVVVLKRLSEALRDGDNIHGILRGSALNHGGKTNGYTVPNPQAQAAVIAQALAEARIHPRHISYLEAHGTGTKLGDPIEIAALTQAFRRHTEDTGFCRIGSAKSNIGHCESAAGIAGLTKVLLQMRHGQIVPSLHSGRLNPHIDFARTPFEVNQALREWERPVVEGRQVPRLAGISSFGAGGSNAHVLVEEYVPERPAGMRATAPRHADVPGSGSGKPGKRIVPLSARTAEQLQRKAGDLLEHLREASAEGPVDLDAVAYTLQAGREAMEERLGFLAETVDELLGGLRAFCEGAADIPDAYQGRVKRGAEGVALLNHDEDMQEAIGKWMARKKHGKLLELWVKGLELDWDRLHGDAKPRRVALPTYPFARDRYWIDAHAGAAPEGAAGRLHPLVHRNTSDFGGQSYASSFTGREAFLADHRVRTEAGIRKVLPAAAYLEMIRAAVAHASAEEGNGGLELRDLAWLHPFVVEGPADIALSLACDGEASEGAPVDFEVYSGAGDGEIVHCQGTAIRQASQPPAHLDLARLEAATGKAVYGADRLYSRFTAMGLEYGSSHRTLTELRLGEGQSLARLSLPASPASGAQAYVLHPGLLDGALQACVGLLADLDGEPGRPALPFTLDSMRIFASCNGALFAWCRYAPAAFQGGRGDAVARVDIDLCDPQGQVRAELRGFAFRPLGAGGGEADRPDLGTLLAVPEWVSSALAPAEASGAAAPDAFAEHHVIVCGLPDADGKLAAALPQARIVHVAEERESLAARFEAAAIACFECVRAILQGKPREKALVQVVAAGEDEVYAGLSALLATASLENPLLAGQTLLVPAEMPGDEIAARLRENSGRPADAVIRYAGGSRQVSRWIETAAGSAGPRIAYQDRGVYLITGGLGGLGLLFARDILERTRNAKVILTGRSAPSQKVEEKVEAALAGLSAAGRAGYRQLDPADPEQAGRLIAAIVAEHGRLNGILHSAGMIQDGFILRKDAEGFRRVLAPKVAGACALDEASRDLPLDFLVFFSSTAGVVGNPGQADYAVANAFMDRFAAHRNRLVAAGRRSGHTLSIAWPLWEAGGMQVEAAVLDSLKRDLGMHPLAAPAGLEAFHRALELGHGSVLVAAGDRFRLRRKLLASGDPDAALPDTFVNSKVIVSSAIPSAPSAPVAGLEEMALEFLKRQLCDLLKIPSQRIDAQAPFEAYGINSVLAMNLTNRLEKVFGPLSKTLFFEYQSLRELAAYFLQSHGEKLAALLAPARENLPAPAPAVSLAPAAEGPASARRSARRRRAKASPARSAHPHADESIAIVGLSGRYPEAPDLRRFWRNLRDGKDCIVEVPADRWDWREYFSADRHQPGRHYSKWGGFIAGVDEFDPRFFNISPREAEAMDPQERLFLQHAWMAIEDAGYSRAALQIPHPSGLPGQVGVYAGVMYS
ncbi:MAG TPA: type I polyketide synthase, partial [Fibrobacteria bacterium]|nr:type I polyketide synthase [Fibrobacteria bacterium]